MGPNLWFGVFLISWSVKFLVRSSSHLLIRGLDIVRFESLVRTPPEMGFVHFTEHMSLWWCFSVILDRHPSFSRLRMRCYGLILISAVSSTYYGAETLRNNTRIETTTSSASIARVLLVHSAILLSASTSLSHKPRHRHNYDTAWHW
jgi:hypothetical protein